MSKRLVNYVLRPAKNIERKMLCEAFLRLARLGNLDRYRYIGFGSVSFVDFTLFHQRLGFKDMVSIERKDIMERVEFNRPFKCIDVRSGDCSAHLPELLKVKKPTITWLDYESGMNSAVLGDVQTVASSVTSGSVIVITINAEAGTDLKTRVSAYTEAVGLKNLVKDLKPEDLAQANLFGTNQGVVDAKIDEVLSAANAKCKDPDKELKYSQLFNFRYKDGTAMMQTIGGMFLNVEDSAKVTPDDFSSLPFYAPDSKPFAIEPPVLTQREIKYLDAHFPSDKSPEISFLSSDEVEKYRHIYRYFPHFLEPEL